ncbi:aminopeptidase P family protein [Candidatus Vallotiella sp. (ex Adelges kitamiensis)]|uniref:aminopeptidase P family protein n=1 Tax=Candidatus Vallotiella sp. (ex Adelges kitamiensis) TaxID=2864217 RepID=UPI00210757A2|nr:aminopeptidase P family protein [Candidatus Vallotia sp. (ex Adelges kitamiensis)]
MKAQQLVDSQVVLPAKKIARLRDAMKHASLDAYIVLSADPHSSEYLPQHWKGFTWLSGFTGSAGLLVVTSDFAGLWTDSRYWVQAAAELACSSIHLMKMIAEQEFHYINWLVTHMASGTKVGVDGSTLNLSAARVLQAALQASGIHLYSDIDLLNLIWEKRPALPKLPVYEHNRFYAPVGRMQKLYQIRSAMRNKHAQWHFISTLDDIAWIFNLRGSDVSYSPVFVAHALISLQCAVLYIPDGKIDALLRSKLVQDNVHIASYEEAPAELAAIKPGSRLLIDPRRVTYGLMKVVQPGVKLVEVVNPSIFAKSCKTEIEIDRVRETMEQDGAALSECFAWLEQTLGREHITELTIDKKLTEARARRRDFVFLSFPTIAAFNANSALPHYRATLQSNTPIKGDGLLLIDSGGQYLGGTTDVTRIIPVGRTSAEQRRDFTLVLKGMIALSRLKFPRGIYSPMLDAIARAPIWDACIDFGHSTGHGVGYFLSVHEGPQVISRYASAESSMAMEKNMITSNEPGIYRPGKWGIRIENLLLSQPVDTTEFGEFLCFETLTLCPIDIRCIEQSLLREDEINWLNAYHALVRQRVGQHLSGDAKAWLEARTEAI